MRILLLEDNMQLLQHIMEMLELQGHAVTPCSGIYEAIDYVAEQSKTFDCIIVDLNMSTIGLTPEQAKRSQGGLLTGWVWLVEYAFKRYDDISCIVYSSFIDSLKTYLQSKPDEKKYLSKITLIPKNIDTDLLLDRELKRIAEKITSEVKCKSVFLSFCSKDSDIANIVEERLVQYYGNFISISRWERDVKYKGSFREFMDSLREHDFVLSIISDQYLKSRACMYEIGKIIDERYFRDKLHYIVLSDDDKQYYTTKRIESIAANVYNVAAHFNYVAYWKEEYELLSRQVDEVGVFVVNPEHKGLVNETQKIINDIQKFLSFIYDARGIPFSELIDTDFEVIKDAISNLK